LFLEAERTAMTTASTSDTSPTHLHLACMEIWGGKHEANASLALSGIAAWVASQPHLESEEGGDIHYVSQCGSGHILRFLLADVAGHGASVSGVAADLRKLMRRHVNKLDNSRFARALNDEFTMLNTDGIFATAVLVTWFRPSRQLIIANAGHPRPLWYRAATGSWERLEQDKVQVDEKAANLPLGVIEGTPYHQFAVTLDVGDLVLIYTDALLEARNPAGRQLNEIGLLGLARSIDPAAPADYGPALLEAVADYRGGAAPDDDQTLMVVQHNESPGSRQSFGDRLKVLRKMLGLSPV
jgi:sigma-B regulation protein RsbU (phosphoserine phosphatase)